MKKIKETIWVFTTSKTTSNFDKSNSNSESRLPKFISFSLLIDQDIWSDLQLQFWWQKSYYDAVVDRKSDSQVKIEVW